MFRVSGLVAAALSLLISFPLQSKDRPIPVKVVIVTMFERGADAGDQPGELQYWVERNHLDRIIPFPQGFHDLRMNKGLSAGFRENIQISMIQ
jgi:purine nucleoside permease